MLKAGKKDGLMDGDQMKINKHKLMQIISEEIKNILSEEDEQDTKLKATTRTAGQSGQAVKDKTISGAGVIDGVERGMIEQIYNFFNDIAGKENVDLQRHRMTIQTALQRLKKLIDNNPQGQGETQ